jgi:hypothetical protein
VQSNGWAAALDLELQARGIALETRADCEAIITAVLEKSANAAESARLTAEQNRRPDIQ